MRVCGRAYNVCSGAYIQKKIKEIQRFGMYALAHTRIPTKARLQMAPNGARSARKGTQKARKRAQHHRCVGCDPETPKGVPNEPPRTLVNVGETAVAAMGWSPFGD